MSNVIFLSQPYLAIRLTVWLILWISVAITTCCVCEHKGPNQILYRLFLSTLSLHVLADILLLGYAAQGQGFALLGAWIFFNAAASATFVALLTLLSSGYSVTRKVIRGLSLRLFAISIFYFLTQVMMDYTILELKGTEYFDIENENRLVYSGSSSKSIGIIYFSFVLNILTLLLVWISIVDLARREEASIQGMISELNGQGERGAERENGHKKESEGIPTDGTAVRPRVTSTDVIDPIDELESVPVMISPDQKISVLGKQQLRRKLLVIRAYSRMGSFYVVMMLTVLLAAIIILNTKFCMFLIIITNLLLWFVMVWFAIVLRPKSEVPQEERERQQMSDFELSDIGLQNQLTTFKKRRNDSTSPKFSLDDEDV
eukprot:TRINITY_DN3335_c0_g2_i5.p2 TRINITY_DN3335_c0_g2~~TRINITY_DN3335_c0_g2_i5.p2  ORF type:complete len:399 (-),score=22.90 TRINITY_DN3335_c0_g2_i5:458-1579(-)